MAKCVTRMDKFIYTKFNEMLAPAPKWNDLNIIKKFNINYRLELLKVMKNENI